VSSRIQDTVEAVLDADRPHRAVNISLHSIPYHRWHGFREGGLPRGALYYASFYGLYDLAKHLLIKHPEHVNARGGPLVSPLGAALYRRYFEVAELLHEHGADVNVWGNGEWALLHVASRDGPVDTARWLLNHGAVAMTNWTLAGPHCIRLPGTYTSNRSDATRV